MFKKAFALFVVFVLAALPVWWLTTVVGTAVAAPQATIRYVAPGGTNGTNDCANQNNPCGSVAHAALQTDAGDTVLVASGRYTETDTIRVFRDMTIRGEGLDKTIIGVETDPDIHQVFQVYGNLNATISHLTMHNAERSGVQNLGNLTLAHVSIQNNRGIIGGGGINNTSNAVITVTDSIISNNGIGVDTAAGMMNFGTARLERVLFAGNKASSYGGGLHNQGTLWLENVTFTLNEAQGGTAVSNGGDGVITMTNVTIARNVRTLSNPPDASAVSNYGVSITAVNTLIADNGPNQQCGGDIALTSLGHNLDGHNGCNFNQPTDLTFTDPLLGAFAQVTGTPNWVSTLMFFPSSPALDAGSAVHCPATDARGVTRPKGNGCDIGAYEFDNYRIYLPITVKG
ncbi:MAG: hypothetical protein HND44_01480 [Chloroflexi bacterium]|nr:hypothetical protein [Ardenticatenaceae bacterium]MBL1127170.1 hypothetical protein [Chloroflexota bacterium]NOG33231.1 hypothetical protein [Chloroflexota bacterium]GIK55027.1 MAG: hypothetical protein BroJett015_06900 [Chloroflexota bacterium]